MDARRFQNRFCQGSPHRSGFTLIELMVVIGIILVIAVMTATAINLTISGDKVRAGGRQVQSFLAGARDRAIYSKAPRGVRFLLDSSNNRTVTSMVYIAPTEDWIQGNIEIEWYNGVVKAVRGFDTSVTATGFGFATDWPNLFKQGLLKDGVRIKIPNNDTGDWYTVDTSLLASGGGPGGDPVLLLTTAYGKTPTLTTNTANFQPAFQQSDGQTTYLMELPPGVMPNQEPVLLPKGAVIHLDRCSSPGTGGSGVGGVEMSAVGDPTDSSTWTRADKLPSAWKKASTTGDPSGFDYSVMLDVMFSPRGTVIGPAAQNGYIHFYVADVKDADLDRQYWKTATYPTSSAPEYGFWTTPAAAALSPNHERGDKTIVTVFTRTGAVSVHPVHPIDTFKFAETGEVAGK